MNGSSRRAQSMAIGQRREQVSLHSFSLSLSLLLSFYVGIECFLLLFYSSFSLFFSFAFELSGCVYILLCSITPYSIHARQAMPFCNILLDQVLPSPSTYIKMYLYICNDMQTKRKRVDLSSVLHMHVHICIQSGIITSHSWSVDLQNIIKKLRIDFLQYLKILEKLKSFN